MIECEKRRILLYMVEKKLQKKYWKNCKNVVDK